MGRQFAEKLVILYVFRQNKMYCAYSVKKKFGRQVVWDNTHTAQSVEKNKWESKGTSH